MCSNFENITARMTASGIRLQLGKLLDGGGPFETVHVWPRRPANVIRADEEDWHTEEWRWSLVPFWSKEGPAQRISTYNARAETVHSAPAYRGPWRSRRRRLVPAIAWYEPAKTLDMVRVLTDSARNPVKAVARRVERGVWPVRNVSSS